VRNKLFYANRYSKTARIRQTRQTKTNPCKIGQIRQKLGVRQKYFLPARRLSNQPEFCKSGGENHHLATLRGVTKSVGIYSQWPQLLLMLFHIQGRQNTKERERQQKKRTATFAVNYALFPITLPRFFS
jgi:hypothetical protein